MKWLSGRAKNPNFGKRGGLRYSLYLWKHRSYTIDVDTQGDKRTEIMEMLFNKFGHENVLSIGAYQTEGSRSTVKTACRGMGISTSEANNMSKLIGDKETIQQAFFGDKEKGIKPNRKFCKMVKKHKGLKDVMFDINGLVNGISRHAAGVVIFNKGYLEEGTVMMRTSKGLEITQYNDKDTEFLGGMKFDLLSVDSLTQIRTAMDFMLEDGVIEWQGSLKETYNKYFHPDIIDLDSDGMFDMLYDGVVHDVFQFSTDVGEGAINDTNPQSFDELVLLSSLMRLTPDKGQEDPIQRFVRYRENIDDWHKDMIDYGLTDEEREIVVDQLGDRYGMCVMQEDLMLTVMNPKIANYTLEEANIFRSNVGKQNVKALQEEKAVFFEKGNAVGSSDTMLEYIWEEQLKLQFDYSFSLPHVVGYTFIAFIQMNICFHYHPIYWQSAVLSVFAGADDLEGQVDYGRMATAMGRLKGQITSPDINKSDISFRPDVENNRILMGLKPIQGIGVKELELLLETRPFKSFEDYLDRLYDNGMTLKKTVILIKSGCFDDIDSRSRRELMIDFIKYAVPERKSVNMQNFNFLVEQELIDTKYKDLIVLHKFRSKVTGANAKMNDDLQKYFVDNLIEKVKYKFSDQKLIIDKKDMEKYYQEQIEPLREHIGTPEMADKFNQRQRQLTWFEECRGSVEKWEMDTISYYTDKHELDYAPIDNYFPIIDFNDLPEEPTWFMNGNYKNYDAYCISGTVVEKNKQKSNISLLTQHGVVNVKVWNNVFNKYDEDNGKSDPSWFERGTHLVLIGHRKGEQFFISYYGSKYDTGVFKINQWSDDKVQFLTRR